MENLIYLDNAATTELKEEVYTEMLPYFGEYYGNASGNYRFAEESRGAIEKARRTVAEFLHAEPKEIYFTSGGSESDNWALKGAAEANRKKGKHIITTCIEHHAVLRTAEYLESMGYAITYLPVDGEGFVDPEDVRAAIREDTILISVMFANNEIGTLEPIQEIGEIAREHHILFHTDAVQAYGHEKIDVQALHVDLLSASGHKFGGPKGVGILYIREGTEILPFIHGGAQERGMHAGTYNTPGIVGFGKATAIAAAQWESARAHQEKLRDYMIQRVEKEIPEVYFNGPRRRRLCNNVNFSFLGIDSRSLLALLDQNGITASAGSACQAGSNAPSHVILSTGVSELRARSCLRFSLSPDTARDEIDYAVDVLKHCVERIRKSAPMRIRA